VDNLTDNLVITHRENLRGLAEKAEALIPDLLERGRAPTGDVYPKCGCGRTTPEKTHPHH